MEKNFTVQTYGTSDAKILLIQMSDVHEQEGMEKEIALIKELSGGMDFCLKTVCVGDWNEDLSPWYAPAVFGKEDFGDGAADTLAYLTKLLAKLDSAAEITNPDSAEDLSVQNAAGSDRARKIYLGGYSLAGLFALWAAAQTNRFDGIAAASPSAWFPGLCDYLREHEVCTDRVYLSLGDREERTKNPVMSQVGNAIREVESILKDQGKECILEWNPGNHFQDPELRMAKGFAWLLKQGEA